MLNRETAKKLYLYGLMYGYPICCIEQFIIDRNDDKSPASMRIAIDGYVPCENCQKKILEHIDERITELLRIES